MWMTYLMGIWSAACVINKYAEIWFMWLWLEWFLFWLWLVGNLSGILSWNCWTTSDGTPVLNVHVNCLHDTAITSELCLKCMIQMFKELCDMFIKRCSASHSAWVIFPVPKSLIQHDSCLNFWLFSLSFSLILTHCHNFTEYTLKPRGYFWSLNVALVLNINLFWIF